jgi:hypothetical protein
MLKNSVDSAIEVLKKFRLISDGLHLSDFWNFHDTPFKPSILQAYFSNQKSIY